MTVSSGWGVFWVAPTGSTRVSIPASASASAIGSLRADLRVVVGIKALLGVSTVGDGWQ
jgi:hypothetical protein